MTLTMHPTGFTGSGVYSRGTYDSNGNSHHRIPRSVFVAHGGTTTSYTFHVGNDFGMSVAGGYVMLTGHGWQTDHVHGMIEFHNAGGGDGLTSVYWREILRNNCNISVGVATGETHKITITLSNLHNNGHGWQFHLYGGH